MFSWYKYLIVYLVFSHLGFWNGNLFLIAPLPDLCLLVLLYYVKRITCSYKLYEYPFQKCFDVTNIDSLLFIANENHDVMTYGCRENFMEPPFS